ncbi:MAG TPA: methionine gamma-lyase family protein [Eubacteriales bacterium]|nr:methionine gamma-lyase family protein [Eubacteriales bacterium]
MKKSQKIIEDSINELTTVFERIDNIALINQNKVLKAFQSNQIALRHMNGSSGYGYDDAGREALSKVFADTFGAEDGIVTPNIVSGTHALTVALFGLLRPNDILLSISGKPYDTLSEVLTGKNNGSLADFGVNYRQIDLTELGEFDLPLIEKTLLSSKIKMIMLQRSRGYAWRKALTTPQIQQVVLFIKKISPETIVFVDNCYGEFMNEKEPTDVGADVMAGSLIKNPGGGIAPTGGYIVGKKNLIKLIEGRVTSPSIGMEVGSYLSGYLQFFQGIFLAPHVVAQAAKTAVLFSASLKKLGYEVLPDPFDELNDIVCSVKIGDEQKLIDFCQAVQRVSPIDSFVKPVPWDMPGYQDKVIMAAGCFVQGASIELSCDAPIKPPYIAYFQGGLTFEHGKIAVAECLKALIDE